MGSQQRLDSPAEDCVIPTGAVQVGGPRGRVGPFEGFEENGHQLRVVFGHRSPPFEGISSQCPVRPRNAPRNPRIFWLQRFTHEPHAGCQRYHGRCDRGALNSGATAEPAAERVGEPGPSERPLAVGSSARDAEGVGRLTERHPREEP